MHDPAHIWLQLLLLHCRKSAEFGSKQHCGSGEHGLFQPVFGQSIVGRCGGGTFCVYAVKHTEGLIDLGWQV